MMIPYGKCLVNYAKEGPQGFSKVLFSASGGREERKWGHPTPRLGTAVPKNPARLLRNPGKGQKFRDKYGAGQVKAYYPKLDVAVEVPLA